MEYRSSLESHLSQLRDEYQQLEHRWHSFSSVYEGNAADQFKDGWARTTSRFREYIDRSSSIIRILDERIQYLQDADRQEGTTLG